MSNGNILLVVAHQGYNPIEYGVPKKILEDAGYTVVTASNADGVALADDSFSMPDSTSENVLSIPIDILISKVPVGNYDGIFFIGGPGALECLDNEASYALIKTAYNAKKIIGAICIATRILARADVLKGKQATGWNGDGQLAHVYQAHDVRYVNQAVAFDDTILTAADPSAAQEFGEQIVAILQNKKGWA